MTHGGPRILNLFEYYQQAKTSVSSTDDLVTLVASYEGEREDVGFTLTVYSNCQASWMHSPQKLLYSKEVPDPSPPAADERADLPRA